MVSIIFVNLGRLGKVILKYYNVSENLRKIPIYLKSITIVKHKAEHAA